MQLRRRCAQFHIDLVTNVRMTGVPDDVGPLLPIELPGLPRVTYRAYPLEDHIADKVCALLEAHPRASGTRSPAPATATSLILPLSRGGRRWMPAGWLLLCSPRLPDEC